MPRAATIGITVDVRAAQGQPRRYELNATYAQAVAAAGGTPLLLPAEPDLAAAYLEACDGFILSGGGDVRMEAFGGATHPAAKLVDPRRQQAELALLTALHRRPEKAVLGICLGMQLMALHAGGRLHQHLPELLADAQVHQGDRRHTVRLLRGDSVLAPAWQNAGGQTVASAHHQAVADAGRMRVVAVAEDGVVEAVDDPGRRWYAGVQWHPERGGDSGLNLGIIRLLVSAAAAAS